jgi:hypothetical protein
MTPDIGLRRIDLAARQCVQSSCCDGRYGEDQSCL